MRPPPIGAAIERRRSPNHISAAKKPRTKGTTTAPQPSSENRKRRHHDSTIAFGSAKSATSDSNANASSASAATSLRIRVPSCGTAPRPFFLAVRRAIRSDLHDHGQHHRPALGALVEIRRDRVVDRLTERRSLGQVLAALRLREAVEDLLTRAVDDVGRVLLGHEALRDDVWPRDDLPGLPVDRDDHEE